MKTLKIERDFAASPNLLFHAIQDGTLFACCGFNKDTMKIDFTVGGNYHMQYKSDPEVTGEFIEIVQNQKITFTWSEANSQVSVSVEPREAGSLLRITHELIPDAQWFDRFKGGWTYCVNSLTKKLSI